MPDVRTLQRLLMAAGAAFLLAAAGLLAVWALDLARGDGDAPGGSDSSTVTGFDLRPQRSRATATAEATPQAEPTATAKAPPPPTAEPAPAPVGEMPRRLVIPSIGVEAPIVTLGVDGNGVMESPDGPEEVGWYDFTARPGAGSNAVFSGHVDFHDYGAAVFWDLRKLKAKDVVEVYGEGDRVFRYEVVSSLSYAADEAPVRDIIGATENDTLTLITCDGTFDSSVRQYSHRRVVTAERVGPGEAAVGR